MIKSINKKMILALFSVAWIIFVVLNYFLAFGSAGDPKTAIRSSHSYYLDAAKKLIDFDLLDGGGKLFNPNPIISVVILTLCSYLMVYIWLKHKGHKNLQINTTTKIIFPIFYLSFLITFLSWEGYFHLNDPVVYRGIIPYSLGVFLFIFLATLLMTSAGSKIARALSWHREESDVLENLIYSFGFGAIATIFLIFFLGITGRLDTLAISIMFAAIALFCLKEIKYWIGAALNTPLSINTSFFSPAVLLLMAIVIVASHNYLELLRPIPIGHDELQAYLNTPKTIAETGRLPLDLRNYAWEMLTSASYAITNSAAMARALSATAGIFTTLSIFHIVSLYCRRRGFGKEERGTYPILAAALFYMMPMVVFQSSTDIKVDLPATFFALLAINSFWKWQESKKESDLFVGLFLLGFGFAIKPTLILLVPPIVIFLIYSIIKLRTRASHALAIIAISILLFSISSVPFVLSRKAHAKKVNYFMLGYLNGPLFDLHQITSKDRVAQTAADKTDMEKSLLSLQTSNRTELTRYFGESKNIINFLLLPFNITNNANVSGRYIDIGFVFLALAPILLIRPKEETDKSTNDYLFKQVIIMSAIYWIAWAFTASGIIWYGLPGFLFLLILVVESLRSCRQSRYKILGIFATTAIIVWLVSTLLLRTACVARQSICIDRLTLSYARGSINSEEYLEQTLPRFYPIIQTINADITQHAANPPKVYVVSKYLRYFIADNDTTVYEDDLSTFIKLHQAKDYDRTIRLLKDAGFKYIVYGRNDVAFFGNSTEIETVKDDFSSLILDNPDKIKVHINNRANGILFAEIL
ncbi:MAG: glycosyltransferase family 39 protein [Patescibacteria group bacterium]|jgi:hypothetical protein